MEIIKKRFWLSFDPDIQFRPLPLIYEFSRRFDLNLNIRNSSFNNHLGVIGVEVEGNDPTIGAAVDWLESSGITVEPIELSVIEG